MHKIKWVSGADQEVTASSVSSLIKCYCSYEGIDIPVIKIPIMDVKGVLIFPIVESLIHLEVKFWDQKNIFPSQLHLFRVTAETSAVGGRLCVCFLGLLTSGTQETPAHIDRGGEEAILLGAAMAAADHDVMGEDYTACCHTAVSCMIGQWTADTAHQTTCTKTQTHKKH